jgi:predicted transcriptional regulator
MEVNMEELELMKAIIESNPGINIEDAWKVYSELVTRVHNLNSRLKTGEGAQQAESGAEARATEAAKSGTESITRGYTRRHLKVKPQDAVAKDYIACCICGKTMNTINARHLASHNGLTKEGYLKLCDYPADKVLMSDNHLAKMQAQVRKAQKAREKKQNEQKNAPAAPRRIKKDA